jgi:hypothetical protein
MTNETYAAQRRLELFLLYAFTIAMIVGAVVGVLLEDWLLVAICAVALAINSVIDGSLPKNAHSASYSERARGRERVARVPPDRFGESDQIGVSSQSWEFAIVVAVTAGLITFHAGWSWFQAVQAAIVAGLVAITAAVCLTAGPALLYRYRHRHFRQQ